MTAKKRTLNSILVFFACMFYAEFAGATPITIFASEDTYITEYDGYGGETSTHGDGVHVVILGLQTYETFPIIKFNLTAFSGQTLTSPTVDLVLNSKGGYHDTQSISIRESLVSWDEATASWANFGGTGFDKSTHTGINLTTRDVTFTGISEAVLFTLPASVVQNWIDNPLSNNGLFLISNTSRQNTDQSYWSKEGGNSPSLSFEAIPEPGTLGLGILSAIIALFVRKLRRR